MSKDETKEIKKKTTESVNPDLTYPINVLKDQIIKHQEIAKEQQKLLKSKNKQEYFIRNKGAIRTTVLESQDNVKKLLYSLSILEAHQNFNSPLKTN
jgi:hypothetical protein